MDTYGNCGHIDFGGMRKVGMTDRSVRYACSACGATYDADRCVAARADGERCQMVARRLNTTCSKHGQAESVSVGTGEAVRPLAGPIPSRSGNGGLA